MSNFIDSYGDYNVHILKCRDDNYSYILEKNKKAILFDISLYERVRNYLIERKIEVEKILITHHHYDHIDGAMPLSRRFKCPVFCSKTDFERNAVFNADHAVTQSIKALDLDISVIETPGHTAGHVSYYLESLGLLFSGDTLFSLGCGLVFPDGDMKSLFDSLKKIAALPDSTQVYFSHEYSLNNARFHKHYDLIDQKIIDDLENRLSETDRTTPTNLNFEKTNNIFLKAQNFEDFRTHRLNKNVF